MATNLIVETYQVVAGSDTSDPNPTVLSPAFKTREAAEAFLARLTEAAAAGVITVGAALWVRPSPGAQTMPVTEPATSATLRSDLSDQRVQVVVFARVVVDGTPSFVRLGSLPARLVSTIAA